jgi:membrane peptidoglycan carboxypeptidase
MKKFIFKVILVLILAALAIIAVFLLNGYRVYKDITSKQSIVEKMEELRNNPDYVKKSEISQDYLNAVIAVEDHRYYEHGAIDIIAVIRAIFVNVQNNEFREGGSTITQQVAKNFYFMGDDVNASGSAKKIAEAMLSINLERSYSKDAILEAYVNNIFFGNNCYSIKAASKYYFNKEPKDLTLYEATMLAGIPNAPSLYNPINDFELTKSRQRKVIQDMAKYGYITEEQEKELYQEMDAHKEFKLPEKDTKTTKK